MNLVDPDGQCYAAVGAFGLGAAAVDGPLPIGDAVGAAAVVGSCLYRGGRAAAGAYGAYRVVRAARALAQKFRTEERVRAVNEKYTRFDRVAGKEQKKVQDVEAKENRQNTRRHDAGNVISIQLTETVKSSNMACTGYIP